MDKNITHLNILKREAQIMQKKGLPFIMASVVIWILILLTQLSSTQLMTKNLYTFMCSCFLMPLSFLFSKLIKADIFKKSENPINKLGFLCSMNQMLYIIIVMWAFNQKPEAMVMLYAIVFGAHLFPFAWVYDSKSYMIFSILETIGALILAMAFGNTYMIGFMIVMELMLCIFLFVENTSIRKFISD